MEQLKPLLNYPKIFFDQAFRGQIFFHYMQTVMGIPKC